MVGVFGVIGCEGASDSARRARAISERMGRRGIVTAGSLDEGRWWHGTVRSRRPARKDEPAPSGQQPIAVVLCGEVTWSAALEQEVKTSARRPIDGASDFILELYRRFGTGLLDHIDGTFGLAILDAASKQVVLATDATGSYPLYWMVDQSGLVFGSDLSAVIRARATAPRLNLRAVADYLTVGAVLEDRTLADGISLLDPGTVLTYRTDNRSITTSAYFRVETLFQQKAASRERYSDEVRGAFKAAVDRALAGPGRLGLSLSGGLDSRAILSAANGKAHGLLTYTLGVDGCADHLIADHMSRIAATKHTFFELDESYLRDFLPNLAQMVSITDGMYLTHGLTEMLALHFLEQTGIEVLLRGHGGELAKAHLAWPLHTDPRVYEMRSLDALVPYLSARANYITRNVALSTILTPSASQAAGNGSASSFASVLAGTGLSPAEACSFLYLRELHRRFTVPSLELFRTRVDVRLPFVDRSFLGVLLGAPPEWRDSTTIHQTLTGIGIPKLLKVRNSNTGAPADASPLTEALLDKVNTVLKRLNVRGFRHYHHFDGWMRRMLLQTVETELLAPEARVAAFVERSALQRFMADTRAGTADHSYLLQVLLILELWQRENGVEAAA